VDSNIEARPEQAGPPVIPYEEIASKLELALLRPDFNEEQVAALCHKAIAYRIGSVVVRPSDIDAAVRILDGTGVRIASIAGFPHGSSNTATKLYEGRDLLRRGAQEVALVVNTGKMLSRQFQHVETELLQMSESCHQSGAVLKVVFETGYLAEDLKIILCKMCKRVEADFAETGTGYGPAFDILADLTLLKAICKDVVKIKIGGPPPSLGQLLEWFAAGAHRYGSSDVFDVLDEKKRLDEELAKAAAAEK
jgi:deoxyribose-phosphate aldolase